MRNKNQQEQLSNIQKAGKKIKGIATIFWSTSLLNLGLYLLYRDLLPEPLSDIDLYGAEQFARRVDGISDEIQLLNLVWWAVNFVAVSLIVWNISKAGNLLIIATNTQPIQPAIEPETKPSESNLKTVIEVTDKCPACGAKVEPQQNVCNGCGLNLG